MKERKKCLSCIKLWGGVLSLRGLVLSYLRRILIGPDWNKRTVESAQVKEIQQKKNRDDDKMTTNFVVFVDNKDLCPLNFEHTPFVSGIICLAAWKFWGWIMV